MIINPPIRRFFLLKDPKKKFIFDKNGGHKEDTKISENLTGFMNVKMMKNEENGKNRVFGSEMDEKWPKV